MIAVDSFGKKSGDSGIWFHRSSDIAIDMVLLGGTVQGNEFPRRGLCLFLAIKPGGRNETKLVQIRK
jgi:hypothetical protein